MNIHLMEFVFVNVVAIWRCSLNHVKLNDEQSRY